MLLGSQSNKVGTRRPRLRVAIAVFALSVAIALAFQTAAFGHAIVRETDPKIDQVVASAPQRVVMRFNEPIEIAFGAIRVFATNGRRVDLNDADHVPGQGDSIQVGLRQGLARGTYTVTWRVVSADGHPIEEAFVFHVGAPGENPQGIATELLAGGTGAGPLEGAMAGVARWLNFASLLLLGGAATFLVLVWRRASSATPDVESRFMDRWIRITRVAWIVALVATAVAYVLQIPIAADVPLTQAFSGDLLGRMAQTRFGAVALVRIAILGALAVLWATTRRRVVRAPSTVGAVAVAPGFPLWGVVLGTVLLVALLASPGVAGHAGTTSPVWANVLADTLHVIAAAAWLGGLTFLLWAAYPSSRELPEQQRIRILGPVVHHYSNLAVVAVGVLVLSGVFRSWIEVRALRALTGATYGWVLLAKLGAFLPVLALGAINNRWTIPRIDRAAKEPDPERAPLRTLRRLVATEIAIATVVIALTAFLVNLPPARLEAGVVGPFITDVRLGQNNLNLLVDPNQVGQNEVHLTLTAPSGAPVPVKQMRVLFRMPSEGIGPLIGSGVRLAPGHFVVQGHQLSVPGEWIVEVVARSSRFEEERTRVTVLVNP